MAARAQREEKSEFVAKLEGVLPEIRGRFGVAKIGIFGSAARGEERPDSDVDVLVEFAPGQTTFRNFMALADFLEEFYGRKVDLLTVGGIDPLIRQDVESEGWSGVKRDRIFLRHVPMMSLKGRMRLAFPWKRPGMYDCGSAHGGRVRELL